MRCRSAEVHRDPEHEFGCIYPCIFLGKFYWVLIVSLWNHLSIYRQHFEYRSQCPIGYYCWVLSFSTSLESLFPIIVFLFFFSVFFYIICYGNILFSYKAIQIFKGRLLNDHLLINTLNFIYIKIHEDQHIFLNNFEPEPFFLRSKACPFFRRSN